MGQRVAGQLATLLLAALAFAATGCDAAHPTGTPSASIVSLSPAATDLLLAMHLDGRLVGISAYDLSPAVRGKLPIAGDYERIDWERLASLRPKFLIVQGRPDRLPAGLTERAGQLGIEVINIQIDRLADIATTLTQLGQSLDAPAEAAKAVDTLRQQLAAAASGEKVPALLLLNDDGTSVVGRGNYLDDLLTASGGENVVTTAGYLRMDAEKLRTFRPNVVFVFVPGAREAAVNAAVENVSRTFGATPRVIPITDPDSLLPASNVGRLAATFASALRSPVTNAPSTKPAAP